MKQIHPFPARMAPDLALERLGCIGGRSRVLDPMAGSGVVLRQAMELGHEAIGFDLDPLAVLMARVWTTPVSDESVERWAAYVMDEARTVDPGAVKLDWIDGDEETKSFMAYWFEEPQRSDLRRIAFALHKLACEGGDEGAADLNLLRLALSRIIVTKEPCASLARDTSHSRPHKVRQASGFEVFPAFERSIGFLRRHLAGHPFQGAADIELGDARRLDNIGNGTIDVVMTSPPYLNAIDYLRGHRLALVWLGYGVGELRKIRSNSIGAERGPDKGSLGHLYSGIRAAMVDCELLSLRHRRMIERYAEDIYRMVSEIARVLTPRGVATFVIGNSCLKGTFVKNAAGVAEAARMVGLKATESSGRTLPKNRRYLPFTVEGKLAGRMSTETICSFVR